MQQDKISGVIRFSVEDYDTSKTLWKDLFPYLQIGYANCFSDFLSDDVVGKPTWLF